MIRFASVAAFALLVFSLPVHAEDAPVIDSTVAAPSHEASAVAHSAKELTLKDGTKVTVDGDVVSVVGADGVKSPAPDGEHEAADGTKIKVKDGKLVTEHAVDAAAQHAGEHTEEHAVDAAVAPTEPVATPAVDHAVPASAE